MREINLLEYLPYEIRKYYDFQEIMNSESEEFSKLYGLTKSTFDESFILTASEHGISRFEEMLKITPNPELSLEERRMYILTIYNMQTPYTERRLREMLNGILGEGNYALTIDYNKYEISLIIFTGANLEIIFNLFDKVVPANMLYNYKMQFIPSKNTIALGNGVIVSNVTKLYPKTIDNLKLTSKINMGNYINTNIQNIQIFPKLDKELNLNSKLNIGSFINKNIMNFKIYPS